MMSITTTAGIACAIAAIAFWPARSTDSQMLSERTSITASMRLLFGVAGAGLIVVAVGAWLNAAGHPTTDSTVGEATPALSISAAPNAMQPATISVWEIHNRAHLENLPVQEIDDQSLVFSKEGQR
jgi:hypothetical protein